MHRHALRGVVLSLLLAASSTAQERAVWKIGSFDESSSEFDGQASAARVFVVNQSQPKDWQGVQQAVLPGKAKVATPHKIQFELPGAPQGTYRLRLGLIVHTPRAPVIQIDVNGHKGLFHQPLEDYKEGNTEASIFPQYSIGGVTIDIPSDFLRQGTNEISLLALTDPLSTQLPGGEVTDDAILTYDALALAHLPAAQLPSGIASATATPTVFYKREGSQLSEVVSVRLRWHKLTPRGSITLSLNGSNRTQTLSSDYEFGESRIEFLVPEFAGNTPATINVSANGRKYSFTQSVSPARKWTVYLVPHEHLDVGYSDFQTKLAELHSRVIDEAMEMSDKTPEFSFSLDGYWQAQQYLDGRSEEQKQKFYAAVRNKKIFVPAQHTVMLTGFG